MDTVTNNKNPQEVLFGKTRRAILALLLGSPDESFYLRQIERQIRTGLGAVQRELKQLTDSAILKRNVSGRQVYFQADRSSPLFNDLQNLILKTESPLDIKKQAELKKSRAQIIIPQGDLIEFAGRHQIRKLSLYGAILQENFPPEGEVDVLVEFEEGKTPGFGMVEVEDELSRIYGHKVGLRTPRELSRYFRDQVTKEAEVQYGAD
jgi:uncharacterized protein